MGTQSGRCYTKSGDVEKYEPSLTISSGVGTISKGPDSNGNYEITYDGYNAATSGSITTVTDYHGIKKTFYWEQGYKKTLTVDFKASDGYYAYGTFVIRRINDQNNIASMPAYINTSGSGISFPYKIDMSHWITTYNITGILADMQRVSALYDSNGKAVENYGGKLAGSVNFHNDTSNEELSISKTWSYAPSLPDTLTINVRQEFYSENNELRMEFILSPSYTVTSNITINVNILATRKNATNIDDYDTTITVTISKNTTGCEHDHTFSNVKMKEASATIDSVSPTSATLYGYPNHTVTITYN